MTTSKFEDPEDEKLAVLAKATLRRTSSLQAGALRDTTGRTYVGTNIASNSFIRDAAESVFIIALTSQIQGIESVVFIGSGPLDIAPLRDFAPACKIWTLNENGEIASL